jgi:hypothetical protein
MHFCWLCDTPVNDDAATEKDIEKESAVHYFCSADHHFDYLWLKGL